MEHNFLRCLTFDLSVTHLEQTSCYTVCCVFAVCGPQEEKLLSYWQLQGYKIE